MAFSSVGFQCDGNKAVCIGKSGSSSGSLNGGETSKKLGINGRDGFLFVGPGRGSGRGPAGTILLIKTVCFGVSVVALEIGKAVRAGGLAVFVWEEAIVRRPGGGWVSVRFCELVLSMGGSSSEVGDKGVGGCVH
mmetsp:Transcript_21006/g.29142  ORF Transcript_21006/g.29142 Transcript_21006/m.29142 type:complete len:135 (+) Transcript_21006:171-575(+)